MSFLHYLGLLLVSISWLWRIHILRPPGDLWLTLVLAGLVLLAFPPASMRLIGDAARGGTSRPGDRSAAPGPSGRFPKSTLALLVPLLLAFFTLPRQLSTGPLLCALAVIGGVFRGEGGGRFRPVTACIIGGTVLTVQGYSIPLLAVISSHVHTVPLFAHIIYPFVRLFDGAAALSGGRIFVSSMDEIYGMGVSLEKLAFIPLVLFFIAAEVSRVFNRDFARTVGRLALAFIAYAGVRFIFILFAVVILNNERLFWEREAILLSLVPLPLLIAWVVPFPSRGGVAETARGAARTRGGTPIRAAVLFTAAFFFLVGSVTFHDPGRE